MANSNTPTFAVASYDKIQSYINSGVLTYPSYVYCRDKNTLVFIDKNLQMQDIEGFNQTSIIVVDELPTENIKSNTFYIYNSTGYLLINDILVPVFKDINESTGSINSYNELEDLPVVNKYGEVGAPISLADLADGCYSVSGQYMIGGNMNTTYVPSKTVVFLIETEGNYKYITKLGARNICVYTMNLSTMDVVSDEYLTQSWIYSQGFATETFVNDAIAQVYQNIGSGTIGSITRVSQLENDAGYLTAENFEEISNEEITNFF